jgi:hypothetical protein
MLLDNINSNNNKQIIIIITLALTTQIIFQIMNSK